MTGLSNGALLVWIVMVVASFGVLPAVLLFGGC